MEIDKVLKIQQYVDGLFDIKETTVPKRVVLKLGSEVVVDEKGLFNVCLINPLVRHCSDLMELPQPYEFIFVSSGAFALGAAEMKKRCDVNFNPAMCSTTMRQVIAASGQIELAQSWKEAFLAYGGGRSVAQFLISDNDWIGKDPEDTRRKIENLRRPLLQTFKMRMISVDNGNDGTNDMGMRELVSSKDNDLLAVIRAFMSRAKFLIFGTNLETNVEGVLDENKEVIKEMTSLGDLERVFDHGHNGRDITIGGMLSKVGAGFAFGRGGREAFIVNAWKLHAIEDILAGRIGTRIAIAT